MEGLGIEFCPDEFQFKGLGFVQYQRFSREPKAILGGLTLLCGRVCRSRKREYLSN